MKTPQSVKEEEVSRALARINADVMAIVCALLGGVSLCLMTVWLVIKGGSHPGEHLSLLSNYFIGYSVTWAGALVGLFYGALTGGIVGWAISTIYNSIVRLRQKQEQV